MMRITFGIFVLLSQFSCSNALRDFPDKSSDQYYIDRVKIHLNRFEFAEAIEKITPVLVSQPRNPEVVELAMLAHAGRAGLRTLDLVLELGNISSSSFFRVFAEHFPDADDTDVADIQRAVEILEAYELDPVVRSSDFNLIGMFLYYSRIGVNLHRYAYTNNVLSPTFDHCSSTDLPDPALTLILGSLPKAIQSGTYISDSGGVSDALASMTDAITNDPVLAVLLGSSTKTCPADANECQVMRALIGETDLGIGLARVPNTAGAPTPCP